MPSKPNRLCGCGHQVPPGVHCPCERRKATERKARFDKKRPNSTARGYNHRWAKERSAYLAINSTCVMCSAPATVVDHITPHKGDDHLFWDQSNWQPLCSHHHNSTKQRLERSNKER